MYVRTGARGYSSSLKRFLYPLLHIPFFLSFFFSRDISKFERTQNVYRNGTNLTLLVRSFVERKKLEIV